MSLRSEIQRLIVEDFPWFDYGLDNVADAADEYAADLAADVVAIVEAHIEVLEVK